MSEFNFEFNKCKLSFFVDDFLVDNINNMTSDFIEINENKITCKVDKLTIDQYFPKINNINYDNLQIDEEGKYSISLPKCANMVSQLINSYCNIFDHKLVITDATACVGGNVLSFCKYGFEVNAVEIDKERFKMLKNNIDEYGFKVNLINDDYLKIFDTLKQDVIFVDPPWGGINYKSQEDITLMLGNIEIEKLCNIINEKKLAKMTVLKLPFNYNLNHIKREIHLPFTIFRSKKILVLIIFNSV